MNELLEKITSYHIFNYLLPGILFVLIADKYTHYSLIQDNLIIGAFVYYFIGLVISRVGSLIIQPFLKGIRFLKISEYSDFVEMSKNDHKLDVFSEINNMYRTLTSMFVLILSLKAYEHLVFKYPAIDKWSALMLIVLLLILFICSYIKQTRFITKRIIANK